MTDFDKLWNIVINDPDLRQSTIHGPDHWRRVEQNGIYIAEKVGADISVIKLFALFHDSRRRNDSVDPGHGRRGAEFGKKLRDEFPDISNEQFDLFYDACKYHTRRIHTKNITMGVCWDADRLDLGRIGINPSIKFLNTEIAKKIVLKKLKF
ncbi:hypothetical protein ACFLSX_01780 [Calditrichota bacterium]